MELHFWFLAGLWGQEESGGHKEVFYTLTTPIHTVTNEEQAFFNVMLRQKVLAIVTEISVKIDVILSKKPKAQGISVRIYILGSYLHPNKQKIFVFSLSQLQ